MTPSLLVVNPGQSDDSVQYCQQDDSEDDGHNLSIKKRRFKTTVHIRVSHFTLFLN